MGRGSGAYHRSQKRATYVCGIADRSLDGFNVYDADRRLRVASQTTQNIREASDFRGGVVVHQGNSDGSRFLA
jgi:hypothetical protein